MRLNQLPKISCKPNNQIPSGRKDSLNEWMILTACQLVSAYSMLEVKELHSLYIHINILSVVVYLEIFCTFSRYQIFLYDINLHWVVCFQVFLSSIYEYIFSFV